MSTKTNKQTVIEMWQSFSSREAAKIEPFLCEDAVWIAPADNATAKYVGERGGMAGRGRIVRFILEQFPKVFPQDVKLDVKGLYGDGDIVAMELTFSATVANGRPYRNEYCFVHVLRDGKVAEIREYMDTYKGHQMIYGAQATI